jgi:hypothetical protein
MLLLSGADRRDWFATAESVPLGELEFEVLLNDSGEWADSFAHDGAAWTPADTEATARAYLQDAGHARAESTSGTCCRQRPIATDRQAEALERPMTDAAACTGLVKA